MSSIPLDGCSEYEVAEILRRSDGLAAQGRLRDALEILVGAVRALGPEKAQQAACQVLLDRIETYKSRAAKRIREALAWLDEALQAPVNVADLDFEEAEEQLQLLKLADWQAAYADRIADYERRLDRLHSQEWLEQEVQKAIEECEKLWAEAEANQRSEKPLGAEELLRTYYDKAREIAREASSQINHPKLQWLQAEAERQREQFALAAQVYTSAMQGEQFAKALQDLEALSPGALVPRYRFTQDETGKTKMIDTGELVTIEKAREEIKEAARGWAISKSIEYHEEAEALLRKKDPRTAATILEEGVPKIREFLEPMDRERLAELQERTRQEVERLEEAEKVAQAAVERAADDPLEAWEQCRLAYENYPSTKVKRAREEILSTLQRTLRELRDQAQAALEQNAFAEVQEIYRRAKKNYSNKDRRLDPILDSLGELAKEAGEKGQQITKAQKVLRNLQNALELQDVENIRNRLAELENLPANVLSYLGNDWEDAKSRAEQFLGEDERLQHLEGLLEEESVDGVRRGIATLKELEEQHPDDERFSSLREKLELHLAYLEAENAKTVGELDKAAKLLRPVLQAARHPDYLFAQKLDAELEELKADVSQVDNDLKEAEALLAQNPAQAYEILEGLDPVTGAQRSQHAQLLRRAKQHWAKQIEESLAHLAKQRDLSLEECTEIEAALEALAGTLERPKRAKRWRARFEVRLKMAYARDAFQRGQATNNIRLLEEAERHWRQVCELAKQNQQYLECEQERLETLKALVEASLQWAQSRVIEAPAQGREAIDKVRQLLERLDEFVGHAELPLWHAELFGIRAQIADTPQKREDYFRRMAEFAESALKQGRNGEIAQRAKRLKSLAAKGKEVAQLMGEIEDLMSSGTLSLNSVSRALEGWAQLQKHAEGFAFIEQWWENLRSKALRSLRAQAGGDDDPIEIRHLLPLAMIYLLDPEDKRAQEMLRHLPELTNTLREYSERLIQDVPNAEEFATGTGMERLRAQIKALSDLEANIQAAQKLVTRFSAHDMPADIRATSTGMKQAELDLRGQLKVLGEHLKKLRDFSNDLQDAYRILPTECSLRDFSNSDRVLAKWQELFGGHPAYVELEKKQQDYKKRRDELKELMNEIQRALKEEAYTHAESLMRRVSSEDLRTFGYERDFTYEAHDGTRYQGWEEVRELVKRKATELKDIIEHARPFGVERILDISMITEEDGDEQEGEEEPSSQLGSTRWVVDWQSEERNIRTLLDEGRFDEAMRRWEVVTNGDDSMDVMCLAEAREWLEEPPYPPGVPPEKKARAETRQQRYELALEYADSPIWQNVLLWLLQEVCKEFDAAWKSAHELAEEIEQRRAQLEHGWQMWRDAIQSMGTYFADAGGFKGRLGRRGREGLRAALDQAYQGYLTCREASPKYPRLDEMLDNSVIYRRARERVGYDPASQYHGL